MKISLIVAIADNCVIGRNNDLPWPKIPRDMAFFVGITAGHTVIMGRKTHQSILARMGKPLPKRTNIVVTSGSQVHPECLAARTVDGALALVPPGETEVFCIGGAKLYKAFLGRAHRIYRTRIHAAYEGDAHFPEFGPCSHYAGSEGVHWKTEWETFQPKDENNIHDMTFSLQVRDEQFRH